MWLRRGRSGKVLVAIGLMAIGGGYVVTPFATAMASTPEHQLTSPDLPNFAFPSFDDSASGSGSGSEPGAPKGDDASGGGSPATADAGGDANGTGDASGTGDSAPGASPAAPGATQGGAPATPPGGGGSAPAGQGGDQARAPQAGGATPAQPAPEVVDNSYATEALPDAPDAPDPFADAPVTDDVIGALPPAVLDGGAGAAGPLAALAPGQDPEHEGAAQDDESGAGDSAGDDAAKASNPGRDKAKPGKAKGKGKNKGKGESAADRVLREVIDYEPPAPVPALPAELPATEAAPVATEPAPPATEPAAQDATVAAEPAAADDSGTERVAAVEGESAPAALAAPSDDTISSEPAPAPSAPADDPAPADGNAAPAGATQQPSSPPPATASAPAPSGTTGNGAAAPAQAAPVATTAPAATSAPTTTAPAAGTVSSSSTAAVAPATVSASTVAPVPVAAYAPPPPPPISDALLDVAADTLADASSDIPVEIATTSLIAPSASATASDTSATADDTGSALAGAGAAPGFAAITTDELADDSDAPQIPAATATPGALVAGGGTGTTDHSGDAAAEAVVADPSSAQSGVATSFTQPPPDPSEEGSARGPPIAGLVTASSGGSATSADGTATVAFGPGSVPTDYQVTVATTPPPAGTGLLAASPVFDLSATDLTSGADIHLFESAPVLTIAYDPAGPAPTNIFYLDPVLGPVALPSTVDREAHTISAALPHFSEFVAGSTVGGLLELIQPILQNYVNGVISGTHTQTLGDVDVGGVLTIIAPTLVFEDIQFTGTGVNTTFTGTITITAASAGIDADPFNASFTNITGTYSLTGQAGDRGTLTLSLEDLTLTLGEFLTAGADSVTLTSEYRGTVTEVRIGATGVHATLAGGDAPTITVSDGRLGLVSRHTDGATDPSLGVLVTGSVAISDAGGVTLTGQNWRASSNDLGDLSAAPITVATGGAPVVLDFKQDGQALSGTATLGLGDLGQLQGTFSVEHDTANDELDVTATNVSLRLGAGTAAVRLAGGTGTFSISDAGSSGTASGVVTVEGVPGLSMSATLALDFDTATPSLTLTGNASLAIANFLDLTGDFTIAATGAGATRRIELGVAGTDIEAAAILFGDGTFAAAGTVAVDLTAAPGLSLTGQVTLEVNTTGHTLTDGVTVGGTLVAIEFGTGEERIVKASGPITLVTPLGDVDGNFEFLRNLATNELRATGTGMKLFLGDRHGGGPDQGIELSGAGVALVVKPNGKYAFRATGGAALVNVADVGFVGDFTAEVNTTGEDVEVADDEVVLAGARRLAGDAVKLTVDGVELTGSFVVERATNGGGTDSTADDTTELLLGASGVGVRVGDANGVNVTVSGGEFLLLVASDNTYAVQAAGTASVNGVDGLVLTGTFGFERNTGTGDVSRQIAVGGVTRTLEVGGGITRFGGTGLTLSVLGQQLSGDFSVLSETGKLTVTVSSAAFALGGGIVTAEGIDGDFEITAAGVTGDLTGATIAISAPGIGFSGPVALAIAYTDDATDNDTLEVTVGADGDLAHLDVAGQTLSGIFTFERGNGLVKIAATDVALAFGDFVEIADAEGALVVAADGLAARISASVDFDVADLLTATGIDATLEINTRPVAVDETIGGVDVELPAGSFVRVALVVTDTSTSDPLEVGDLGTLTGSFYFQQIARTSDAGTPEKVTVVAFADVEATVDGQTDPVLTDGEGVFVIKADGVAGYVSGKAALAATGFQFGGTVLLRVNTTAGAVDETFTFDGREFSVVFGEREGGLFELSVTDGSLNIANVVTIEGDVGVSQYTLAGTTIKVDSFAGSGLTIFFGDGPATLADGSPNPLARGLLITNATIALITATVNGVDQYALDARGTVQLVGLTGVTLGGQVRVRVNSFQSGFTTQQDGFDEALVIPGTATELTLKFAPGEFATTGGPFSSVGGTGLDLQMLGQAIAGDFVFTHSAGTVGITASNVTVALRDDAGGDSARGPPFLELTNGAGELSLSSAGVVGAFGGSVRLTLPGVSLSGTFDVLVNTTSQPVTRDFTLDDPDGPTGPASVRTYTDTIPAGPFVRITGTNAELEILGQTLSGNFTFERATENGATVTRITATGVALALGDDTQDYLTLKDGAGALVISSAGIAGVLSAQIDVSGIDDFDLSGGIDIAVNTTAAAALGLPAGPFVRLQANHVELDVLGQTLTGNFAFERALDQDGATVVRVAASDVTLALTAGGRTVVSLTAGHGSFLLTPDGMAAELSGTLALDVPGVTLGATLTLQVNTTGVAVNEVITVGGADTLLALPAGPFVRFAAQDVALDVLGQTLTGDFTIERTGAGTTADPYVLTLTVADASLSLGGGLVTVSGASGDLTFEATGVHGTFAGTVAFAVPGVSFGADLLTVDVDTRPGAGRHLRVEADGLQLEIAGQVLEGDFTLEQGTSLTGERVVKIAVENAAGNGSSLLKLADGGATFLDIEDATGQLVVTSRGVAGRLVVDSFAVDLPGIDFDLATGGSIAIEVNTIPTAVTETFQLNGTATTLSLPAGPYVSVRVIGGELTIADGGFVLAGDFGFDQTGTGADRVTRVAAAGVEVAVKIGDDEATLTDGEGGFVVLPDGIAGFLSGKAQISVGGGAVEAGAQILLRVNKTGGAVDESVQLGGRTVEIKFAASEPDVFEVSLSDLTISIGDFVTIEGDVAFTNGTVNVGGTATPAETFAGEGLTIFLGQGPARLASGAINPLASGVMLTNGRIGLIKTAAGYALFAQGTVSLVGIDGVTVTGLATVLVNTLGGAVDQTLTIAGSTGPGVRVKFDTGDPVTRFEATGAQLSVLGQTLTGNFSFDRNATGEVTIAATGVGLSLAGGAVAITDGSGALVLGGGGLAGRIGGTVALNVPSVTFGGTFTVAINTRAAAVERVLTVGEDEVVLSLPAGPYVRVEGTGVTLTILGQTLGGDFSFERVTGADGLPVTAIAARNVTFTLGSGSYGVKLTHGTGAFLVTSAGIAGELSGTVALTLPAGVSFTGDFALAVNNTNAAVSTSFQVGGESITLDLVAGPYLRVEGTGVELSILGQTLTGNFAFERVHSLGANGLVDAPGVTGANADSDIIRIAATGVTLNLGGGLLTLTNGSGALLLTAAGVAGDLGGSVALNVPGVTLSAGLRVRFNTTGAKIDETIVIGGSPVDLNLPLGPYVQVAGTGVDLNVLGQTLRGDFVITRTTDALGRPNLDIELTHVVLELGGTSAAPLLTATQIGNGFFRITPAGVAGELTVDVALNGTGFSVDGDFTLALNTTAVAVGSVPAGPYLRVGGDDVTLSVAGQVLTGSFAFEQTTNSVGQKIVRVGVSGVELELAGGLVTASEGTGLFVITPAGVAGTLSVKVALDAGLRLLAERRLLALAEHHRIRRVGAARGRRRDAGAGPAGRALRPRRGDRSLAQRPGPDAVGQRHVRAGRDAGRRRDRGYRGRRQGRPRGPVPGHAAAR